MLHLLNLEEIQSVLLQVPNLIDSLERHDPRFVDAVTDWLTQIEHILLSNRLAVAAEIAGQRGVLICTKQGMIPQGLVFNGRVTTRMIREATASDVLRRTEATISNVIKGDIARFSEGERLIHQIVTVARYKGLIQANQGVAGHTEMLDAIWNAITLDTDLASAAIHLQGLVGDQDTLIMLDRALS